MWGDSQTIVHFKLKEFHYNVQLYPGKVPLAKINSCDLFVLFR